MSELKAGAKRPNPRPHVAEAILYHEWFNGKIVGMAGVILAVNDDGSVSLKYTDPNGGDFVAHKKHRGSERGDWDYPRV